MLFLLGFFLVGCGQAVESDPNIDLTAKNGKFTYVGFVASWCPHCKAEVPVLDKFYRQYKSEVNMQLINIDKNKFKGNLIIPQDTTSDLTYEQATGEKCEYVPSYVIYDEEKQIIDKACGAKLTFEELEAKLITDNTNTGNTMDTTYQTTWFEKWDVGVIMTTSNGKIEIKLFPKEAPLAVNNFLGLAQKGYYNGIIFHRVIKNFMIQWGDPEGTGMGWQSIYWAEFEDEFSPNLHNIAWALSMANAGENTNGSQFFINQVDNLALDNIHTVFGQVVNGMDNVDKIASVAVDANDKPTKEIKIISLEPVEYDGKTLKPFTFDFEKVQKEQQAALKAKEEADKKRVVKAWDIVQVHYIGTFPKDGTQFDSSYENGTPLEFTVGAGKMISGFDTWVVGMKIWEKKTLKLKAKDAYGERSDENIQEVAKSELKSFEDAGYKLEVGTKLPTQYGEFPIVEAGKDTVKIDLNAPLAGQDLNFVVELVWFKN